MSRQDRVGDLGKAGDTGRTSFADPIPDYETYDFAKVWKGRGIANEAERAVVRMWARGGYSCLDLGGGYGRIAQVLEPSYERPFLIDYSMRNLRAASRRLSRTTLVRCSLDEPLPFGDCTFDFLTLIRVVHHFSDPGPLMAEIARVARDGATLVIGVANELPRRDPSAREQKLIAISHEGHRIYSTPIGAYFHPFLLREEIRGVGLFDNRIGRRLEGLTELWKLDVATSRLWPVKPMLFVRFRVKKQGQNNEPDVRCPRCGAAVEDGTCSGCGHIYGKIVDLAGVAER